MITEKFAASTTDSTKLKWIRCTTTSGCCLQRRHYETALRQHCHCNCIGCCSAFGIAHLYHEAPQCRCWFQSENSSGGKCFSQFHYGYSSLLRILFYSQCA